ncbi:MAG: Ferredoxin--NADP reductase [Methanonatronarchaeales archaeon]|nr:Ferredoxin--NADP reductase [Methanonatronarchaeales archaeon]
MRTDAAIIGAGPAGLFAAHALSGSGLDVVVLEKGKPPLERKRTPVDVLSGVGGAGGLSDGKLNLTPDIGMELEQLHLDRDRASALIDEVDAVLVRNGVDAETYGERDSRERSVRRLRRRAATAGIQLIHGRQKHVGSENMPNVVQSFAEELDDRGVQLLSETEVESIERDGNFSLQTAAGRIQTRQVVAAPGRSGADWFRSEAERLGIEVRYGPIDVGVRVELPREVTDPVTDYLYDPKLRWRSRGYDDLVRTFCTNPGGYVTAEHHGDMVLVNGHAKRSERTRLTNFAILTRIHLTEPVEDTKAYGRRIAELANTIGGGRPLVQRLRDLLDWQRSTSGRIESLPFRPTLDDCTPGDIALALPQRVVMDVIHALETLDEVIPGVNEEHTLLYAPEIKFYDSVYPTDETLQTEVRGLRVAGDGCGKSRGIVGAAVSGLIAGRGALNDLA